jgi:hypothetical protein
MNCFFLQTDYVVTTIILYNSDDYTEILRLAKILIK